MKAVPSPAPWCQCCHQPSVSPLSPRSRRTWDTEGCPRSLLSPHVLARLRDADGEVSPPQRPHGPRCHPQGSAASEEELAKAMEGLGLEEGGGEGGVLPVVQSVLQHLLSREVLYPSLKEITDKVRGGRGGSPRRCHSTPSSCGGTGRRWGAAWGAAGGGWREGVLGVGWGADGCAGDDGDSRDAYVLSSSRPLTRRCRAPGGAVGGAVLSAVQRYGARLGGGTRGWTGGLGMVGTRGWTGGWGRWGHGDGQEG